MESIPAYVSVVFILTTFAAIGIFLGAVRRAGLHTLPAGLLLFLLPLWIVLQAVLSIGGVYENYTSVPPRLVLFGILPAIVLIAIFLVLFRRFVTALPLRSLTMIHVVRIPVEIVLYLLFLYGQVPQMMTFDGRNFDILSGILAPIVYFAAFRVGETRRGILFAFNIIGLLLLANIVSIAALSLPSAVQMLNIDQPNRAVLYFPYVYLPVIVVPIVLFSHIASLIKLFKKGA